MISEGIFSKKAFEAESVDLSNEEARCLQRILRMNRFSRSRSKTRSSVFFVLMVRARVEAKIVRRS